MIRIYRQNDDTLAYVKEFVADTDADIQNLPTDSTVYPGSTCVVTSSSKVYMLSANKEWVEL
jgi:hypothetical protein